MRQNFVINHNVQEATILIRTSAAFENVTE